MMGLEQKNQWLSIQKGIFEYIYIFDIETSNHFPMESIFYNKLKINTLNKKSSSFQNCFKTSGWLMGLEPTTLGTTNQYSNQLSYNHRVF